MYTHENIVIHPHTHIQIHIHLCMWTCLRACGFEYPGVNADVLIFVLAQALNKDCAGGTTLAYASHCQQVSPPSLSHSLPLALPFSRTPSPRASMCVCVCMCLLCVCLSVSGCHSLPLPPTRSLSFSFSLSL